MPDAQELFSVFVMLQYVLMATVVILFVGLEKTVWLLPLLVLFVVVLSLYTLRRFGSAF